jgi:hypothetical protein
MEEVVKTCWDRQWADKELIEDSCRSNHIIKDDVFGNIHFNYPNLLQRSLRS